MRTFLQWAKANKKNLVEDKIRTGIHTAMPKGYVQHEYPDAYYYSHIGTAPLDLQNLKKVKDVAPSDNAP